MGWVYAPRRPPHWALRLPEANSHICPVRPSCPSTEWCPPGLWSVLTPPTGRRVTATRLCTHTRHESGRPWCSTCFLSSSLVLKLEGLEASREQEFCPLKYLEWSLAPSGLSTRTWMNKWTRWPRWCLQLPSSRTRKYARLGAKEFLVGRSPGKLPGGGGEAGEEAEGWQGGRAWPSLPACH